MRRAHKLALTSVICLLLSLVVVGSAQAEAGTGTLSSGGIYCLEPVRRVDNAAGLGYSDLPAKFSIWWGSSASNINTRIFVAPQSTSYNTTFDISNNPGLFPGYFQSCVNNTNVSTINFTIAIGGG